VVQVLNYYMSIQRFDYIVVGGGIVGLSVAWSILEKKLKSRIAVLEKESRWAQHQTGRNSGVIHSGIYYKPGSLKARLCHAGNRLLLEFCQAHGIKYETCGKVIVATDRSELPRMQNLYDRGIANGLVVRKLSAAEVKELEPHVSCVEGMHVPSTGIVSYTEVCLKLAARWIINCAGLQSDRVAKLAGLDPGARIVPFRGEYYELKPERRSLVRNLIYPVPDPEFPFLGVHFTRMIDGSVHAGPNAVLSLKREGYHRTSFNLRDFTEIMTYPGFWRMAAKNAKSGLAEMYRSFSKKAFVRSLQRLIPEVREEDLVPGEAGVRAQALRPDGGLVDDFLIVKGSSTIHVCNAPSPAATACLEIGRTIAGQIPDLGNGATA
jgi:L-2-hydroxyglutarate oxidase